MILVGIALDRSLDARAGVRPMTEEEFELFYRRNARPLLGYLTRVTGNPSLADDLLQRTFIQFLRARLDSTEERRLRGLLYRIASNVVVDEWRERKRTLGEGLGEQGGVTHPADPTLRWDLGRAFQEMSPKERAMLWLAHVEGAEHHEIASALGLRKGSVKVLLHRARKKLAAILESRGFRRGEAP